MIKAMREKVLNMRKKLRLACAVAAAMLFASGCTAASQKKARKEKMEKIMNYSAEELSLFDEYLTFSAGATCEWYKDGTAEKSIGSARVPDMCALPDDPSLKDAKYIRTSAYISFESDGNQHLSVEGPRFYEITVTYNEVHTEPYSEDTFFKANVFYKVNIAYVYKEGMQPVFHADSGYKLSVYAPSFGGVPSTPLARISDEHLRDPFIMLDRGGKYYMTGTYDPKDWKNTKEIHIYRSDDLAEWEDLGAVWNYEKDATWQKELITDGSSPIWAPELHYVKGNYYICYSLGWGLMGGAVLRSTTGIPEGPYEDICTKPVFDTIDATLFVDDDGKVYAIWGDGLIAEMDADMTGMKTAPKALMSESGKRVGFEGCYVLKIGGLYYLCSATYCYHFKEDGTPYQTYDSFYAISDNLFGPYSERRLLLKYGGHNNLFFDKEGKLFTTAFYGPDFSERPAIAELTVTDEGLLKVK